MLIYKCDSCKKEISSSKNVVSAGYGHAFASFTLCVACGLPVISLLKKKKLLDSDALAELNKSKSVK